MSNENTQANNAPAPQSLVLDEQDISVAVGRTRCLWAQVTPADAGNYTISWSSSNPSVASVSDGNVTAHATGPAVISAWIPGTGLSASCNVEVVPFVPVSSISVTPESWDLYVGDGYCLAAEVCPANATNPVITWSSKDEEIASVGEISGVVYAHKDGQTIITATVNDGTVEKTDTCILTVNTRPPVKGVKIEEDAVYMNEGERCTLHANVLPAEAADRGVIWVSDNEAVAKVGACSGEVEAISAGSARISAVTKNLEFSDCVPVKVFKDTVTIEKIDVYRDDGYLEDSYTQVTFRNSGHVWKCVDFDLVGHSASGDILQRAQFNVFNGEPMDTDIKLYPDDELRLLFAIDPHGVAYYVKMYALHCGGDWYGLEEKDHYFRVLYNREPKYYMRDANGKWWPTDDTDNKHRVLSESESLFGGHLIVDGYTIMQMANVVLECVIGLLPAPAEFAVKLMFTACLNSLINTQKSPIDVLFDVAVGKGIDELHSDYTEAYFNDCQPEWVKKALSIGVSAGGLILDIGSVIEQVELPAFNGMVDYCLSGLGYGVIVKRGDAMLRLGDIQNYINEYVDN